MSNERLEWINKRAYQIWEELGRPSGQDQANWEQANREFEAMEAASVDTPETPAPAIAEEPVAAPAKTAKPRTAPKKAAVPAEPGAVVKKPRAKPSVPKP